MPTIAGSTIGSLPPFSKSLRSDPCSPGTRGFVSPSPARTTSCPCSSRDGRVALPLHGAPSSHILKPAVRRIEDSVHNEGFCLALAKATGLDAAAAEIRRWRAARTCSSPATTGFAGPDGRPRRVHQEDFCQALSVAPEYKYQNEGGPSLVDCFALVRRATRPAALYLPRLLDGVIFNTLIGNQDAHAKNYSLVYGAGGTTLAPLHDVLSTAVYPELTSRMATEIGGYYEFKDVMPRHWESFAKEAGLSAPQVRRRILASSERLPAAARTLHNEFTRRGLAKPILERIIRVIEHRCSLTRARFADVKSVPA